MTRKKWVGFRWAQEHESVRLGTVGTDEYDMTPQKRCSGLIPILNPVMVIARRRARKWLEIQPDAWLIHFSLERTNEMLAHRGNITDYEIDAVIDMAPRRTVMYEAFQSRVRQECLKVSDAEADALWEKIVRICGGTGDHLCNGCDDVRMRIRASKRIDTPKQALASSQVDT